MRSLGHGGGLHLRPNAQQVAAPDLRDLLLGIPAPLQFHSNGPGFTCMVPPLNPAAAAESHDDSGIRQGDPALERPGG